MKRTCRRVLISALCCMLSAVAAEAKEVRLVLFPFEAHSAEDLSNVQSGIATMLPGRVSMPGQIIVLEPPGVKADAGQKPRVIPAAEQLAIAKKAGADYLLAGSITKMGAVISIDARLVNLAASDSPVPISVQSQGFDGIIPQLNILAQKARESVVGSIAPAGPAAGSLAPDDSLYAQPGTRSRSYNTASEEPQDVYQPPPRRPQSKPSRFDAEQPRRRYGAGPGALFESAPAFSAEIKGKPLHAICSGDVNGDGKNELIAAGPELVNIYQLSGNSLTKIAEIPVGIDEHVVHVDAGDFNGNGIDELYVSCYETQRARSFIVEFQQNQFIRIAQNQRWFYHVYKLSDASVRLIGQEAGTVSPFSGDIFSMEWKEGKLISREQFILPGSRGIYGFGEGDVDADGVTDFLVFDKGFFNTQPDLILVSATSKTVWRDTKNLGGTPNFFSVCTTSNEIDQKENVPLRIICADISPDGRWAVIVGKNNRRGGSVVSKLFDFTEGQLQCLLWDGADLALNWSSPVIEDFVTDYLFDDIDKDGVREIIMLSSRSEGFGGASSNQISMYKTVKK
ncbi:MAG: VCBS repeat-containing protein [Deltaproteobacteria bacterium]|nr:VCBS repeat-containing protein [Deltaproteobacteria bacterium]